jgi:CubicO group peptidase (beta-lactamase class C family)
LSKDTNSLSVDPKFMSPPSNFHLQSGSPVKDKGEGGVDMGAYPGNAGAGLTISLNGPAALSPLSSSSSTRQTVNSDSFVWQTASPESQGLDSTKLDTMANVLASRKTKTLLIVRNDRIIYEWYGPGRNATQRYHAASLAKTVVGGVSLMVAFNDGHIKPDDYASKYIRHWTEDPFKSSIRIRHLASDTSGIEDAEGPEEWKSAFWKRVPDPFSIALNDAPALFYPGSNTAYSNPGTAALAYAITASLRGKPLTDIHSLLKARILDPLGISEGDWSIGYGSSYQLDGMKIYPTWGGASFTPRAVAKVGLLMLHKGSWQGRQLVRSSWATTMVSRATAMPDFGLTWSINLDRQWTSLPRDAYAGAGSGHQLLLVIPSLNLVVVRNGGSVMNESDFWAGLEEYVFEPLMGAIKPTMPKSD